MTIGEPRIRDAAADDQRAVGHLGDHWHTPGKGRPQGLVVGYGTPRERVYPEALEVLGKVLDSS